ncbi:unnamed protein product [Pocillopora meandrina]|uniref:Oxaloacetate tautomerase FAHD1, mitochondrial n=1 Tax=Pocillopora meandrina TaxID=46732 RepID=A0AAU9XQA6_9CNID|nr:unnamed protein product [Pocillopora meandrina]
MDHVGGYTLALDMTDFDLIVEKNEAIKLTYPWALAKGFDTATPVSEFIPKSAITDPNNVKLWLKVDGEMKQDGNTQDMIYKIPHLISFVSRYMTLEEGDLILTGTPEGGSPVKRGQTIICGLGDKMEMTFPIKMAAATSSSRDLRRFVEFGRKIIAVGRNYREHAAELGNPVPKTPLIFLKPPSSYLQQGGKIKLPPGCDELHHEVELGVVISKTGASIAESNAMDYVGGYALALDMTARDLQNKAKKLGQPWTLAKGFDTALPVSRFISKTEILQPDNVHLWLKVDGELKQDGNTRDMIFTIPYLISYISQSMTLEEGDFILTGTPEGVSEVKPGQTIACGLGDKIDMTFPVVL